MNILAVDPTLSNFGYALYNGDLQVIDVGVFRTEKSKRKNTRVSDDDSVRTQQLARLIGEYIVENKIKGIMGERPTGGSKSFSAAKSMAIGSAVMDCISALFGLPIETCTPNETKKSLTGKATASKKTIMEAACRLHGWKITKRSVNFKKGVRIDSVYWPLGRKMGAGQFEHIADAIAAFEHLRISSQIIKTHSRCSLIA